MRRRWLAVLFVVSVLPSQAIAQTIGFQPPPGIKTADEGTDSSGRTLRLNCVGAGITCTKSGATTTMTVSGGAGTFSITQVEIDYDTCGVDAAGVASEVCEVAVTDAGVTTSSKILLQQAGVAATGRDQDENELDDLLCTSDPQTGSFNLTCRAKDGPTHGKFKLWYTVS